MKEFRKISIYGTILVICIASSYLIYDDYKSHKQLKEITEQNKINFKTIDDFYQNIIEWSSREDFSTKFDDEIILIPEGLNVVEVMGCMLKAYRTYSVAFGITEFDYKQNTEKDKLKEYLKLNNVENAIYCVFFNDSKDKFNLPDFDFDNNYFEKNLPKNKPNTILFDKNKNRWSFILYRKLNLDIQNTFENAINNNSGLESQPIYSIDPRNKIGPDYKIISSRYYNHFNQNDSLFYYDMVKTNEYNNKIITKRVFTINFEPPFMEGWYKIRIFSNANRILSISKDYNNFRSLSIGPFYFGDYQTKIYMDGLFKLIKKYDVTDFNKIKILPHDDSNLESYLNKLNKIIADTKLSKISSEYHYLLSFRNLISAIYPQMNKFAGNKGYIDFNIFVRIPKIKKNE